MGLALPARRPKSPAAALRWAGSGALADAHVPDVRVLGRGAVSYVRGVLARLVRLARRMRVLVRAERPEFAPSSAVRPVRERHREGPQERRRGPVAPGSGGVGGGSAALLGSQLRCRGAQCRRPPAPLPREAEGLDDLLGLPRVRGGRLRSPGVRGGDVHVRLCCGRGVVLSRARWDCVRAWALRRCPPPPGSASQGACSRVLGYSVGDFAARWRRSRTTWKRCSL